MYTLLYKYLEYEESNVSGRLWLRSNYDESDANNWPRPIIAFFLGLISEDELIKAAKCASIDDTNRRLCEVYFYAGKHSMIKGDDYYAAYLFRKAIATNAIDYFEYTSAMVELEQMEY